MQSRKVTVNTRSVSSEKHVGVVSPLLSALATTLCATSAEAQLQRPSCPRIEEPTFIQQQAILVAEVDLSGAKFTIVVSIYSHTSWLLR